VASVVLATGRLATGRSGCPWCLETTGDGGFGSVCKVFEGKQVACHVQGGALLSSLSCSAQGRKVVRAVDDRF
jgi:hypothetical protein